MGFLYISISGIIDIFANLALAKSQGFKKIWFGLLALVLVELTFLFLYLALKDGMSLPVAYTLWGAIGILGTTFGGFVLFKQGLKPIGIFGIVLVLIAVYLLHFA